VSATSGVVLARTAGGYRVHTDAGEIIASLRGKLKYQDSGRVVPGDVVVLEGSTIAEIRPRRSVLARRAAQGSSGAGPRRAQPVAANVDQVIVVTSARDPEPSPRMIDRFLVIAEANGLPAAVVLNKIELDRAVEETLARRLKTAGYQLLGTSVKADEGLPALRDLLRGRHSVFTGASGAGKSSLLNQAACRRHQREMADRQAHDDGRRAGACCRRRVRRRYAWPPRNRRLGHRSQRAGRLLSGIPPVPRSVPLRQLPPPR